MSFVSSLTLWYTTKLLEYPLNCFQKAQKFDTADAESIESDAGRIGHHLKGTQVNVTT